MSVTDDAHGTSRRSGLVVVMTCCVLLSCTRPVTPARQATDPSTWTAIRRALEGERQRRPRNPWTAAVSMTMREPRSGHTVDGRGAMAVAPGRALRMILVGAAGATMLDAWVTADQWRIAVPPAGILRRGDRLDEPVELPVGFLRWLFFRPLDGTLFGGSLRPGRVVFLLRDDDSVIDVRLATCGRGQLTTITRRARGRAERLDECRASVGPVAGDWAQYEDEASGLKADLTIESVGRQPPPDEAFRDPDADGTAALDGAVPRVEKVGR